MVKENKGRAGVEACKRGKDPSRAFVSGLVACLPPRQEINSSVPLSLSLFLSPRIPHTVLFAEESNRGFVDIEEKPRKFQGSLSADRDT